MVPFTHETKASTWERDPRLRAAATRFELWERSFSGAPELLEKMDEVGIERALVPAITGRAWEVSCEYVRGLVETSPSRLYGTAGIDPSDITKGVQKLDRAVRELGFVGAHSFPHWFGLAPDDRAYYPFYAKCVELDVPVQVHVGSSYYPSMRDVGRPETIDAVAVDFPDLRLVAIHTGYPWERELVSVAWKQTERLPRHRAAIRGELGLESWSTSSRGRVVSRCCGGRTIRCSTSSSRSPVSTPLDLDPDVHGAVPLCERQARVQTPIADEARSEAGERPQKAPADGHGRSLSRRGSIRPDGPQAAPAIITAVTCVLARATSGMIDASATRRASTPITVHSGSTTERESSIAPIRHVPAPCADSPTVAASH